MLIHPLAHARRCLVLLVGVLLTFASLPASSGENNILGVEVQPLMPVAGEPFTVGVRAFPCHIFFSEGPLDRIVEVEGSIVRVTVEYLYPTFGVCIPPYFTWSWTVDPLPAGSYTLVFVGDEPFDGGMTLELGRVAFTVAAPRLVGPNVIPATQPWALVLLALALMVLARAAMRGLRN